MNAPSLSSGCEIAQFFVHHAECHCLCVCQTHKMMIACRCACRTHKMSHKMMIACRCVCRTNNRDMMIACRCACQTHKMMIACRCACRTHKMSHRMMIACRCVYRTHNRDMMIACRCVCTHNSCQYVPPLFTSQRACMRAVSKSVHTSHMPMFPSNSQVHAPQTKILEGGTKDEIRLFD